MVLRKSSNENSWYNPKFKSPLYPYVQIFGTIAGGLLIVIMGEKALYGALAACVLGVSTYFIYGKKNYDLMKS